MGIHKTFMYQRRLFMLVHNFNRKSDMNVNDILQDVTPDNLYSSVFFTLVNLPYKAKSSDIKNIELEEQNYECYTNHYRFDNGTMILVKIASNDFVPYGVYARKNMNFLIAEYSFKKNLPHIYDEQTRRMIDLGKKPIDYIEKICGTRKVGSDTRKAVLQQLEAILNCRMAIATGYRQIFPEDDERFLKEECQFALIESQDKQLVNHKFDVFNNWQPTVHVSNDLSSILSSRIFPLERDVYLKITSPMELDIYQFFSYQGYNKAKKNDYELCNYHWDIIFAIFGRGYEQTSKGLSNFKRDFRKCLESLQKKTSLLITAPKDAKGITFRPQALIMPQKLAVNPLNRSANDYNSYKPMLDDLFKIESDTKKDGHILNKWDDFIAKNDLLRKFDKSAITTIKKYFELDAEQTKKTMEYAKTQNPRNMSAYLVAALNNKWIEFNESFKKRLESWQIIYDKLTGEQKRKIDSAVSTAIPRLRDKWLQEQIDSRILTLIYARYLIDEDRDTLLQELTGSRYQTYFIRSFDLFNLI